MKKIKINEAQAKLLSSIGDRKVLKVTREQYNRILEMEVREELQSDEVLGVAEKDGKFFIGAFSDRVTSGVNNTIESLYRNPKYVFSSKEEAENVICKEMEHLSREMAESSPILEDGNGYNFVSSNINCETLSEELGGESVQRQWRSNLSKDAKTQVQKSGGDLYEMYTEFVNELYNVNEGAETKYDKLIKLMEDAGYIRNRKIRKEAFNGKTKIVEKAISHGLYEVKMSGSAYKAMETIEEVIDQSLGLSRYDKSSSVGRSPEQQVAKEKEIKKTLSIIRKGELERRAAAGEPLDIKKEEESYDPVRDPEVRDEALDSLEHGMKTDQRNMKKETAAKIKEDEETKDLVKGLDILQHEPFSSLPDDRIGADFNNHPEIYFQGEDGKLKSFESNIFSKDDLTGSEFTHPRTKHVQKSLGFIKTFIDKYGEEPIFEILPGKGAILKNEAAIANKTNTDDLNTKASFKKTRNETDAESSGQFTGNGGVVKPEEAKHKSNVITSLKTKDDYEEPIDDSIVDEMTAGTDSMGQYDLPMGRGDKDKKFWHPEGSAGPRMSEAMESEFGQQMSTIFDEIHKYIQKDAEDNRKAEAALPYFNDYGNYIKMHLLHNNLERGLNKGITEDSQDTPQYPGGTMITPKDKCKKFPYCDEGPGNFNEKKSKDAVISKDTNVYETIAKKTGKSINEIKEIIERSRVLRIK